MWSLISRSAIHTPACLWRRTGEIYKANKEFSVLTGIPSALLRGGKIGIYELMTEESMVRYYQVGWGESLVAKVPLTHVLLAIRQYRFRFG